MNEEQRAEGANNPERTPKNLFKNVRHYWTALRKWWGGLSAIEKFTFVSAASACLYTVITLRLYFIAKDQLAIVQQAFVYADSPFIVGDGELPSAPLPRKRAFIVVNTPNSGDTVARHAIVDAALCITASKRLPDDFAYPHSGDAPKELAIFPKSQGQIAVPIADTDLVEVENNRKTLFVYGEITYTDIFDHPHKTEFCVKNEGAVLNHEGTGIEKLIWNSCSGHNCQDRDCPNTWGTAMCPN